MTWSRAAEGDDRDLVLADGAAAHAQTAWERLIVPPFVYFFAQLYPFRRVNPTRGRRTAAGGRRLHAGAPRGRSERAGGLAPIRGARIDDVALRPVLKRASAAAAGSGCRPRVVSVRPYPRLADLWQMVARSAYIQLRYSPWLLAGTVAGLACSSTLLPPAGAITGLAA